MLKKVALAVMFLCGIASAQNSTTSLEPGKIYNTGNLVNWTPPNTTAPTTSTTSPWINGVYQQSLTCWYYSDPGNCGPNPTVTPGNINFSYGTTNIYQVTSVAAALPNSGTGLNVNGYNFSFMAKNGNGWDNGQQDYLMAYVKFYGPNGNTVANYDYNLNYKFDWTYFNLGKTFDTPYASKDLTAAQYGFVGRDNNYWAGTYGPEITNISFSLKYSVDPCATNPMYSPTCPGYLDALNKLLPQTTLVSDPISSTSTSGLSSTTIVTDPIASTVNVTSTTSIGQPTIVAPVVSAPTATTTSSSTTNSQTQKESSGSGSNTSLALSIISKNSDRDAAGSAVAQAAVSQAQAVATQAQQEAASVAASAVANSMTANAVTIGSQQSTGTGIKINNNNNSNSTNFTLQSGVTSLVSSLGGPQTNNNTSNIQQQNSSGLGLNVSNNQPVIVTNIGTQQSTVSETVTTFALPLLQPQQPIASVVAPTVFGAVEQPQVQQQTMLQSSSITSQSIESYAVVPPNFLTDKSNPLTDIVEGKNTVPQNSTIATTGPSVNKNSGDNEVAGGVDINKMALAPVGYGDYLNLALRDATFYAPKEVYKNQRNVDNARLLRQLSSDSKHKEMVELQYAK